MSHINTTAPTWTAGAVRFGFCVTLADADTKEPPRLRAYRLALNAFPAWETLQDLMDCAKECWLIRELTAE